MNEEGIGVDPGDVIESLTTQIAQQAQMMAMKDAAMKKLSGQLAATRAELDQSQRRLSELASSDS